MADNGQVPQVCALVHFHGALLTQSRHSAASKHRSFTRRRDNRTETESQGQPATVPCKTPDASTRRKIAQSGLFRWIAALDSPACAREHSWNIQRLLRNGRNANASDSVILAKTQSSYPRRSSGGCWADRDPQRGVRAVFRHVTWHCLFQGHGISRNGSSSYIARAITYRLPG